MSYFYPGFRTLTAQIGRAAHPDVLANKIAQEGVAAALKLDPEARADLNVVLGNQIYLGGQIRSLNPPSKEQLREIVIHEINNAGYNEGWGYDVSDVPIIVDTNGQSSNIHHAVANGGAGDTIRKYGLATFETPEFLPLPHILVRRMAQELDSLFEAGALKWLGPDGKLNIDVKYEGGRPKYVSGVEVAAQHALGMTEAELSVFREYITREIVLKTLGEWYEPSKTKTIVNGAGLFEYGGPITDRGVKGKKDADHAYGDILGNTGGSAYGKDGSKVDLHALLLARQIALSLHKSGYAPAVKVQLKYPMGQERPSVVDFDTIGTSDADSDELERIIRGNFDLEPGNARRNLSLQDASLYAPMAKYFFGDAGKPWEKSLALK